MFPSTSSAPFAHAPPQRSNPIPIPVPTTNDTGTVDPLISLERRGRLRERGRRRRRCVQSPARGNNRGADNSGSASASDFGAPASHGSSDIFRFSPDPDPRPDDVASAHQCQRVPFMYTPPRMSAQAVRDVTAATRTIPSR
ncbi:hypothetical protein EW145_g8433, partial [Phellinidium pouzarii]